MDTVKLLPVNEVYGPVLQGEGPHAGRLVYFMRLGGCNLACQWCDTPYTWDANRFNLAKENPLTDLEYLLEQLPTKGLLVISGGEPLMHQGNATFLAFLQAWAGTVHVETNGTIVPSPYLQHRVELFMVSPKVNEQGDIRHKRIKVRALEMFAHLSRSGRAAFKVVCETEREVTEAAALLTAFRVPKEQSWVMPQGLTSKNVLRVAKTIEPAVVAHGLNLTLRQHVLLHEDKRGV